MKRVHLILFSSFLLISSLVFAQSQSVPKMMNELAPKMDVAKVIEVAVEYAKTQKVNTLDYAVILVSYKGYSESKNEWAVQFLNPHRPEGDWFWVYVDDISGKPVKILWGE